MNIKIDHLPNYQVAYVRQVGPYGPHNIKVMEKLKSWAKKKGLFNKDSTILSIPRDNPKITPSQNCRYDAEEIGDVFLSVNIEYVKLKVDRETFIKAKIEDYKQFKVVMPFLYSQGSMNCFAAWSLSEDLFSFKKRDMKTLFGRRKVQIPIVTLRKDCTMFWIFYDGASVVSLSNDDLFSSTNSIISSFPKNIKGAEVEYEE